MSVAPRLAVLFPIADPTLGLEVWISDALKSVWGALVDPGDAYKHVRRNFAKDAPDISVAHHALRVELAMNMTMKAVVPHSPEAPYYSMGRFEWGKLHNPHVHGFNGGASDPTLEVRPDMIWDASDPEQEVQTRGCR